MCPVFKFPFLRYQTLFFFPVSLPKISIFFPVSLPKISNPLATGARGEGDGGGEEQFLTGGFWKKRRDLPSSCDGSSGRKLARGLRISMDLETENRLAALLMEEARRLRREADKDGVHIYLQKPNVRGRPNSRFLTATVLGVEQANRAAEISELWRARDKERELDAKQRHESRDNSTSMHVRNGYLNEDYSKPWLEENSASTTSLNKRHKISSPRGGSQSRHENDLRDSSIYCSSTKRYSEDSHSRHDDGLQDDDIEEFLQSRVKRGRGSVGCRMDEPGPYLPSTSADLYEHIASSARRMGEERARCILGPEKPHFLKSEGVGYSMLQATDDEWRSKKDHHEKKMKSRRGKSENKRRKEKSSKNLKKHMRRDSGKRKT